MLQTYSLVNYLKDNFDVDVQVINYYPKNLEICLFNALKARKPQVIFQKLVELKREKEIKPFRCALPLTKRFYTNQQLKDEKPEFDCIFAGSDQIWNPSFLMWGEKKISPTYYLDFAGEEVKKISLSASFGCEKLPENCVAIAKPLLERFSHISVRENTGKSILLYMGIEEADVTADPTSLLSRGDLLSICGEKSSVPAGGVSRFILRNQNSETEKLIKNICEAFSFGKVNNIDGVSIPEWLLSIKESKLVVTNSFHCVMMCLKLHTPFAVVPEVGRNAGMNDRFITLLQHFDLTDRIVHNEKDINALKKEIDFSVVDKRMQEYSLSLKKFIEKSIKH